MVRREAATGFPTGSRCGLGPRRALVSLGLRVLRGLCVGGGGPPSAGDAWQAGSQARQKGRPSTARGRQGWAAAGGCLGLSRPSVSPSAMGKGLGVGCPGWGVRDLGLIGGETLPFVPSLLACWGQWWDLAAWAAPGEGPMGLSGCLRPHRYGRSLKPHLPPVSRPSWGLPGLCLTF